MTQAAGDPLTLAPRIHDTAVGDPQDAHLIHSSQWVGGVTWTLPPGHHGGAATGVGQELAVQLSELLGVIRQRWRLIVVCVGLAVLAAIAVTLTTTPVYEARARIYLSAEQQSGKSSGVFSS
ncbi:Wzz/FepE/Etk N-terminal domain-containing protein [Janibacter hoylei]|uniref:Wzz/FepE/Etk N-terminal domain-containing protein n=1 Tax=Janibacter hoylei TaxID=364298 RepID=UPI002236F90B|nr:Wzz/FepE/Etk N-terminal domain-containing protein [Janibacter hoylei]MCW4601096.1 Wzz/FepE/Etk N-terminal domain-containing protein [Janibacter hoylei]